MMKRRTPAKGGAMPESPDPKGWGHAAVKLAESLGAEAFVAAVSIAAFAYWQVKDIAMHGFALAVIWSLFAFRQLGRDR
jgi:hypothetical protein